MSILSSNNWSDTELNKVINYDDSEAFIKDINKIRNAEIAYTSENEYLLSSFKGCNKALDASIEEYCGLLKKTHIISKCYADIQLKYDRLKKIIKRLGSRSSYGSINFKSLYSCDDSDKADYELISELLDENTSKEKKEEDSDE